MKTLLLTAFLFFNFHIHAQLFEWVGQMGGTSEDHGLAIAVDGLGNVYTAGRFDGTVDFDPGTDSFYLTATGLGSRYIQKLDPLGNFLWAKQFASVPLSIATDAMGNVCITGTFSGTVDFDPGPDTLNLTANGSNNDIFIQKLDANGNLVWARQVGSTGFAEFSTAIAVDGLGNVFTTGSFNGTIDFDPGAGTLNLSSIGQSDQYVLKLDAAGNLAWAKQTQGGLTEIGNALAVDGPGNVYITGHFVLTADFDPGPGVLNFTSAGERDIYIQKLDPSGNLAWASQFGGTFWDSGEAIAVDALFNVYITGPFSETVDFDPGMGVQNLSSAGGWDSYILKLSQDIVGTESQHLSIAIQVYPNPSAGTYTIDLGTFREKTTLTITDISGKVIQQSTVFRRRIIDVFVDAPAGVYFLNVQTEKEQAVVRLLKN